MSSSPPTPSLPLPTVTTAPLAIYTTPLPSPSAPLVASSGAATAQMPAPSTAPPAAAYTPEEITGVLNDLVTAVQGIRLYLASPYGPPPPLPLTTTAGLPPILKAPPSTSTSPTPPLPRSW